MKVNERIADELRKWISEYYDRTGKLPEFPSEDAGGSRTMFSRQGEHFIYLNLLNFYYYSVCLYILL